MQIARRTARAGVYAEDRYQRGLESWRRKTSPWLAVICGPLIVGGLVILVVDRQDLSWFGGAIAGIFMTGWIWIRESPPRYVEQWHDGAEGERKTEKALRPLEKRGWTVVHDIQEARFGNYDHVAVGPSGVYLLETKNLQGIVEVRDGVTHLKRRHDSQAVERFQRIHDRALAGATHIKGEIEQRSGHRTWVQAVVIFWSEFPAQMLEEDRCVYIHGSGLKAWLERRPLKLDEEQVEHIARVVERFGDEQTDEIANAQPAQRAVRA
jgi:hypothetical protein